MRKRPQTGSIFWFGGAFPRRDSAGSPSCPPALPEETERIRRHLAKQKRATFHPSRGGYPVNREVMFELLRAWVFRPILPKTARKRSPWRGNKQYLLVLMDVQMPRLDGLEATRALRSLPGYAKVPILALTANAFDGDRQECIAAGMDDHIPKPVEPSVLYATLARWITSK